MGSVWTSRQNTACAAGRSADAGVHGRVGSRGSRGLPHGGAGRSTTLLASSQGSAPVLRPQPFPGPFRALLFQHRG